MTAQQGSDAGGTVELAQAIEVLRKFTRCSLTYEHRGQPDRQLRWDCADDQCQNPGCIRYTTCTRPEHDAADLVASYDAQQLGRQP